MKSRFSRTLCCLAALLGAGVLISVVGTRARMRPHSTQAPIASSAHATQRSDHQFARDSRHQAANPFNFRETNATALWSAAFAPAVVTTIVNYNFNSGTSYSSLTPALASGVLSGASATEPFVTFGGIATTAAAFTANTTAGNGVGMNNSSGTNTRYFQFTLGGSSLTLYNSYKVYVQAQRNATGAQTLTLAYKARTGRTSPISRPP